MRGKGRIRDSLIRRIAPLVVVGALVGVIQSVPAAPGVAPARRAADRVALRPEVFAAALEAGGTVMRTDPGLTVERVRVPAGLGGPTRLYRVTVRGRFVPRAQRYIVLAGGQPVGYGIPTGIQGSVETATADESVLTAAIAVRYEGGGPRRPTVRAIEQQSAGPSGVPNPGGLGPYEVTRAVYDLGAQAFQPSDLGAKVELTANVHYPSDLSAGPYPLVLFMHGNHSSCYRGSRSGYRWPCREGWKALPNYAGYDYIARPLASHGFIVVSVSANGVNVLGNRVPDTGMRQRGELLDRHIDLWREWSTTGGDPFGDAFLGKVDLSLIGTMGHSRGGEGVVWHKILDEERDEPYGIDAVLALAPVDFTRRKINEAAFAVVLPYCDGDVFDLQGIHFFDDSRYAMPGDPAPKHTVTVFEANHNFFNTVWSPGGGFPGAFDDGEWSFCSERLTQARQRRVGRAYIVGFFRRYLAEETALDDMWTGAATPGTIAPARTHVSYLAPDDPTRRLDLGRFMNPRSLAANQAGGGVSGRGMSLYGWCANRGPIRCVPGNLGWRDVHFPGLPQAVVGWWGHQGVLRFEIPDENQDVQGFDALQFRAVVNPGYGRIRARHQDLNVVLIDEGGASAEVAASDVGNEALAYPLSGRRRPIGHIILNQVRFPLHLFEEVDLSNLEAVELRFSRTRAGVLNITDVAFSGGG